MLSRLYEIFCKSNFVCLNIGLVTFMSHLNLRNGSVLDLTFTRIHATTSV